jgi:hypothetical protein
VDEVLDFDFADFVPSTEDVFLQGMDYTMPSAPLEGGPTFQIPQANSNSMPFASGKTPQANGAAVGGELLGLGMSETVPPFEITEEL